MKQDLAAALDAAVGKTNPAAQPEPEKPAPKPKKSAKTTKFIGVYMPEKMHESLRVVSFKTKNSVSAIVVEAIAEWLKAHPTAASLPKELR